MTYLSGKAIEGGTPLSDDEVGRLAEEHLRELKRSFSKPNSTARTQDELSRRLAEELRLVARMIDLLEQDMLAKGDSTAAQALERSEEAIEDVAEVIEAEDGCDALEDINPDMARRLTRRSIDGEPGPCDNRRPSILRKSPTGQQDN